MTNLLGSKRWITAIAATGTLIALGGCASSEPAGSASPSAGESSASPAATAEPSAAATSSPDPGASAAASPSADAPSPSASAPESTPAPASTLGSAPASEGATPSPSPSAAAAVPAGPCTAGQLTGAVEDQPGGGAAGSVYRTLVLTNASDQDCIVDGYPGVSFVDASGTQLGAAADRDGSAIARVTLAPGGSVATTLRQTDARNYAADCGITPAAGLRVYPPGATDSLVLPQEIPACSAASIVLMTVGALQPAS